MLTICSVANAGADEQLAVLKVGSETYLNVTVTSVTATDVYFKHSQGLGNARLKKLEPEMQKHFHFNPDQAAAIQVQRAEANSRYHEAARNAPVTKPRLITTESPMTRAPQNLAAVEVPPHSISAKSFLNQPAPALTVEKWITDPPNVQGKFVLIDFWATWCGPCRASIPHLNQLHEKFKDRVVVLGISSENEPAIRRMTQPHIGYSIASDTHYSMERIIEVKGIPHAILIDPKGIVRFEGMPNYLNEQNLETLLNRYSL